MKTSHFITATSLLFCVGLFILIWFPDGLWLFDYLNVLFASFFIAWVFNGPALSIGEDAP